MNDSQMAMVMIPLVVFYIFMMLSIVPLVLGQVFIGLGIRNDSDALGLTKGKLFMFLTIFLGTIPAIIYACMRGSAAKAFTGDSELMAASEKKIKSGVGLYIAGICIMFAGLIGMGVGFILGGFYLI